MRHLLTILPILCLLACSKDNRKAEELDGKWKLEEWSWQGNGSNPAGSFGGEKGEWTFTACKAAKNTCGGTVYNFDAAGNTEQISWYIREKGTTFTMAPDVAGTAIGNFGGEWKIEELSDSRFVITSESCGSCGLTGKNKLTFTKS